MSSPRTLLHLRRAQAMVHSPTLVLCYQRGALRTSQVQALGGTVLHVKNRMAAHPLPALAPLLRGPCVLVTGGPLVHDQLLLLGGVLQGRVLTRRQCETLLSLDEGVWGELLHPLGVATSLVGLLRSSGSLCGSLAQPLEGLLGVLHQAQGLMASRI